MQISKIRITNMLGIKSFEFDAGKFNVINGKNGIGKTSIVEAIKSIFKPGNDVSIVNSNAETGEILLSLDDGTQITKTFGGKAILNVVDADGLKVTKPANFIEDIADLVSVNPIAFLTADKKSRANILLEAMPLKVTKEMIKETVGEDVHIRNIESRHAFEVLEELHKVIYDARTAENRLVKQTEADIISAESELVHSELPEGANVQEIISELENQQNVLRTKLDSYHEDYKKIKHNAINEARAVMDSRIDTIENEYQQQLAILQRKRDEAKQKEQKLFSEVVNEQTIKCDNSSAEKQNGFNSRNTKLTEQLAKYRSMIQLQAVFENQQRKLVQKREEYLKYKANSDKYTLALDNIQALKGKLLSNLPIPGLEIIDGQIFRNGVVFDRLNTAQKVEIAVEISKLRAGKLAIMCVDGIEALDDDTFNEFKRKCDGKVQMFCTKVTNDEKLTILN